MTLEKPKANPYRVTDRDLENVAPANDYARPTGLLIVTVINGFTAFIAAACSGSVLRNFASIFSGFGAELPVATRFVLDSTWLWWLLALTGVAMAVWVIVNPVIPPGKLRRMKWAAGGFSLLLGLLIAFAFFALYLPIFKLGEVV